MKKIFSRFTPHICAVFLFFYCWNVYWGGNRWNGFFLSDSNGYYAYLPAGIIYQDWNFSFIDPIHEKYFSTHDNFDFRLQQKSSAIDKWYSGTAIAILPFFLIGHAATHFSSNPADGYTFWYAWAISIAAIFYCFIGLFALRKILKHFFDHDGTVALILVLILFATNLFYYSTSEPLMSHVYSFAFVNLFVLTIIQFIKQKRGKLILLSAFFLGMIVLIRPVNGVIVFAIPFIAGSKSALNQFLSLLSKMWKSVLAGGLIFFSVLFIQLIFYKLQTGSFFIYSYGNEKMNLLEPHLADFLFSYRKGLFVYLPLILFSLTGFIYLLRKNKWQFYCQAAFIFSLWYLFSSWWNWWYGGSFASRSMIEFLFVFAILLGFALTNLSGLRKNVFVTLCFLCLILCQVQTYQYRYYFIHWDKMNKERYWKVFMRLDLIAKKENPNADLLN